VIATAQLTAADLAALPDDGNRYELLRGDLLTMPPTGLDHGIVFGETFWQFKRFARETDAGIVVSEVGFLLARDPPTVLAPDVAFIRRDRVPAAADRRGFAELAPDLVVEVVSPSNSMSEIHDKVLTFLETGVHAVLVLEPKRRTVTVHTPDRMARTLVVGEVLDGLAVLPGFAVPVADLFA
jgi:Uma2 family endonuclease